MLHKSSREIYADSLYFYKVLKRRLLEHFDTSKIPEERLTLFGANAWNILNLRPITGGGPLFPVTGNRKTMGLIANLPQQQMGGRLRIEKKRLRVIG